MWSHPPLSEFLCNPPDVVDLKLLWLLVLSPSGQQPLERWAGLSLPQRWLRCSQLSRTCRYCLPATRSRSFQCLTYWLSHHFLFYGCWYLHRFLSLVLKGWDAGNWDKCFQLRKRKPSSSDYCLSKGVFQRRTTFSVSAVPLVISVTCPLALSCFPISTALTLPIRQP